LPPSDLALTTAAAGGAADGAADGGGAEEAVAFAVGAAVAVGAVADGADGANVGAAEAGGVRTGVADVAPVHAATTAIMTMSAPLAAYERTPERLRSAAAGPTERATRVLIVAMNPFTGVLLAGSSILPIRPAHRCRFFSVVFDQFIG
jgi:hypothetical protein